MVTTLAAVMVAGLVMKVAGRGSGEGALESIGKMEV
jgi:hypothetical protein